MKLALHATEPATRPNAAAQRIDYDLGAAAQLIEQNLVELLARIEALRVPAASRETKLWVGPVELDLIERTAKRGDRTIDLRPREFRLLEYMMRREGRVLTREMLLREVWNYKFVPETNLVDVHMGRLRRKIDGPSEAPMILNIRGKGFIFGIEAGQSGLEQPRGRLASLTQGFLTREKCHVSINERNFRSRSGNRCLHIGCRGILGLWWVCGASQGE